MDSSSQLTIANEYFEKLIHLYRLDSSLRL